MTLYQQPFFLTKKVSNNAFSFEERRKKLGSEPKLFVPALKSGSLEDVKIGSEIVFEDFDDDGILQSCLGLETFIRTEIPGLKAEIFSPNIAGQKLQESKIKNRDIPVYIFDNHNHAFYFWCLEFSKKTFDSGATLIHVDQHKDNREPSEFLNRADVTNLEKVFEYTNSILNVGNFIPPAIFTGMIRKDVFFVNSEYSLRDAEKLLESKKLLPENMILDIDLDFFAPEFDYIGNEFQVSVVRKLIPFAKMITVATSPFFIEQERAIEFLKRIF